eukprot:Nitzschia sp. Nitz4//scaffold90_size81538//47412//49591//NITZ4_005324-RA/size81538-augustus-gene-0.15-mRNA-1//-1//CDS//3329560026//8170//frame0
MKRRSMVVFLGIAATTPAVRGFTPWLLSSRHAWTRHHRPSTSCMARFLSSTSQDLSYASLGGAKTAPTVATATDGSPLVSTRPYQITTPIYYVNDKPHIGHAYTSTACDVLARFMRLSGTQVFFLTGTDEHGQKVEQSAQKRGVPPQQFVDELSQNFRELLTTLHVSNDNFIRTTNPEHQASVQHLWEVLTEKGYIYKGTYSGWYSVRDECFYNESELIDGVAPTGAAVEWVAKEESYFFKLSAFESALKEWYEEHPDWIAPKTRRNEVLAFVNGGLKDLSISRTSFQWGVPVPGDDEHIMYVWMDALTNYISALGYPNMDAGSPYQTYWPASLHVVGKDILRFHTVYWPAFLMAADLPLPTRVFAHGWWTKEGEKISKSLGNVIDPVELVDKYGVDPTRFFLMTEVGFGSDGDYSDQALILKANNNLANELGNLCQRVMSMIFKNCNKAVPDVNVDMDGGVLTKEDKELLQSAQTLHERAAGAIEEQAIQRYANELIEMVWDANKYIDEMAPWALRKTDPERMTVVLYVLMEVLRYVSILYQPLIPTSANRILDQLTVPLDQRTFAHLNSNCRIRAGTTVSKPQGVFPRIEDYTTR